MKKCPPLVRVMNDLHFEISACDGRETLADETAKDVFLHVDETVPSRIKKTKLTEGFVYEMCHPGTFLDIFGSFGVAHDELCFTQAQIVSFLRRNGYHVRNYHSVFFLLKSKSDYYVAYIRHHTHLDKSRFVLALLPIGYAHNWLAFVELSNHKHRAVVVPKTTE